MRRNFTETTLTDRTFSQVFELYWVCSEVVSFIVFINERIRELYEDRYRKVVMVILKIVTFLIRVCHLIWIRCWNGYYELISPIINLVLCLQIITSFRELFESTWEFPDFFMARFPGNFISSLENLLNKLINAHIIFSSTQAR